MFPKPRGVFLEQKKLRRDPRQLGDFAIFNRRRFLTDKKRACGRILFLIDHRVVGLPGYTSIPNPAKQIYPGIRAE